MDSVLRQALLAVALADVVRQSSPESTVGVDDVTLDTAWQTLLQRHLRLGDELVVQTYVKLVILLAYVVGSNAGSQRVRWCEDEREVDVLGLGAAKILSNLEHFGAADHLIHGTEAELGHDRPQLVSEVVEEVDDMLRRALELGPQLGILSGYAYWAGVEIYTVLAF